MNYTSYNKFKSIVMHEGPDEWKEIQKHQLNRKSLAELKFLATVLDSHNK